VARQELIYCYCVVYVYAGLSPLVHVIKIVLDVQQKLQCAASYSMLYLLLSVGLAISFFYSTWITLKVPLNCIQPTTVKP